MKHKIYIKNMVCNRCKSTVINELNSLGYDLDSLELGQVILTTDAVIDYTNIQKVLGEHGFEIITDDIQVLIEKIKITLMQKLENQEVSNLSVFLPKTFSKPYSALSKIFSKNEGITIEKYLINLKIEKVKEYIQLAQLNFSEVAYSLNYKSSSHLARQFKNVTGMSMSKFRDLQKWNRKTLDQIV
ncbi:helix-turn-helix domain-containing protein [Lacinutrix iliipiscaria]|uniref:Helix-turn-helix domain-containing protein n=1 Tax=Lacinutrix iliipiscaria TaxID=1230532 RepID=A0ABW5WP17_9FLAO